MKRHYSILFAVAAVLTLVACQKSQPQEADVTDQISSMKAMYYADYYNSGTANWVFKLLNEDCVNSGKAPKYYYFEVLLPLEYDFSKVQDGGIPEGVYLFNESCEAYSFNAYSYIADFVTGKHIDIAEGEFVVEDGVFAFTITDVNGDVHRVKWVMDMSRISCEDYSFNAAVTKDHEVTFNTCKYQKVGQFFIKEGIETYQMMVEFSDGNPQIGSSAVADATVGMLMLSSATNDFTGTFTVEPASERNYAPGTVDPYFSFFGSYIGENALEDGYFAVHGGTLTVTADGDGLLFEGEFTADDPSNSPHKLKIHARGVVSK